MSIEKHETGFVTDEKHLGRRYFCSKHFVGSYMACAFALLSGVSAFGYAAPILGVINADIGPNPSYIWISNVYNTCMAVTFPVLGRVTDMFGRRYFFVGGAVLAVVGCIVNARAHTIPTLIGGNVLLGIASGTQLSYHFVLGELVPLRYRYIATAVLYIFTLAGSGFGPAISTAFITDHPAVGWRGTYYMLLGYNVVALLLWVCFYFPPDFRQKHGNDAKLKWIREFDYIGAVLMVGGLTVFLFGISSGGTQYAWKSAPPIVMIILGFLALCALVLWESRLPREKRLIPLHILWRGSWIAAVVTLGFAASVYYTTAILWPSQVAALYANGRPMYGALLSTFPGIANVAGQVIAGSLASIIPKQKWQTVIAFLISVVFTSCCALVEEDNMPMMGVFVFLSNFFMGWVEIVCLTNSTIDINNQQEIGAAGGLAAGIRTGISAISSVVYGTVLSNRLSTTVPENVIPALKSSGLPAGSIPSFLAALQTGLYQKIPGITLEIIEAGTRAYKHASIASYRTVYLVSIAFSVTGLFTSLFTPDITARLSDEVAAVLHAEETHPRKDNEAST